MGPKKRRKTLYKTVAEAARVGCFNDVRTLIDHGHPVDVSDNRGWRPTHDAAHGNHLACLKLLLKNKDTNINHQSFDGLSSLMVATKAGHPEAVRMLLQNGAQPDLDDFMNNTPIMEAASNGDSECLKILLESNPDVNMQNYCGSTALHLAASKGKANITNQLLDHGASLDVREDYNITPIFNAAHHGQLDCLKLLLEVAKKKDQLHLLDAQADDGATATFIAAQEGHATCLQLLLKYGADANIVTKEEPVALPLHAALQLRQTECLDLLLPITNQDKFRVCDMSPWQFTVAEESGKLTQSLVDHGFDVNYDHSISRACLDIEMWEWINCDGTYGTHFTPLTLLSTLGLQPGFNLFDNANILLKAGAVVNPKSARVVHPLLPALDECNQELVKLFIDHGSIVDIYCKKTYENLTMLICTHNWKLVPLMLKCGAEVNSLLSGRRYNGIGSSDFENKYWCRCCMDFDESERDIESDLGNVDLDDVDSNDVGNVDLSDGGSDDGQFKASDLGNVDLSDGGSDDDQLNAGDFCSNQGLYYLPSQLLKGRSAATRSRQARAVCILLQFVGNVSLHPDILELCRSHLTEWQQIEEITGSPRNLQHLCRLMIREHFTPKQLLHEVDLRKLPLPDILKDYICYADMPSDRILKL